MMGRYVSNNVEANNEQHRSKSGDLWDLGGSLMHDPIEPGDPCSSICWAFYANRDNCLQHALRLGVPAMPTETVMLHPFSTYLKRLRRKKPKWRKKVKAKAQETKGFPSSIENLPYTILYEFCTLAMFSIHEFNYFKSFAPMSLACCSAAPPRYLIWLPGTSGNRWPCRCWKSFQGY